MSYDHGPLRDYEVIWTSGRVETIKAHQVILPQPPSSFLPDDGTPRRVVIHGEIDGHWQLILTADAADIRSIRNLTAAPDWTGGDQ